MTLLVYGAYGYTGELIAREAVRRRVPVVLAGRRAEALRPLAEELGLEARAFALDDPGGVDAGLAGMTAMLGCAGPFAVTWRPLAEACLRTGVHYMDITGEIEVFEALHGLGDEAARKGVTLLPGVGFDVVPSDCLARMLHERLPDATHLELFFCVAGGVSRGTATTSVRKLGEGGVVRRGGELVGVPAGARSRRVDFGDGKRTTILIPWGDVATAHYSTGIGDIETYFAFPWGLRAFLRSARVLGGLYRSRPVRALLTKLVRAGKPGPTAAEREAGSSRILGRVRNAAGVEVECLLTGPEGYTFTVLAALACAERVLAGEAPAGYQTPSTAFGWRLVESIDGVRLGERTDQGGEPSARTASS